MDAPLLTVTLKPDVAEQISALTKQQREADALVDPALRAYFARFQREKIHQETQAFQKQRAALLRSGITKPICRPVCRCPQWLGIDHDVDLRTLHLCIFARLGHIPVLLKQVKESTDRELVFRGLCGHIPKN